LSWWETPSNVWKSRCRNPPLDQMAAFWPLAPLAVASARTIFLDVGANNGNFTAMLFKRRMAGTAYFDKVFVFEPNPRFRRELGLLASLGAVHVRAAAWNSTGSKTFYFSQNDEASSLMGRVTTDPNWPCTSEAQFSAKTRYAADASAWDGVIERRVGRTAKSDRDKAICDRPRAETVATIDLAAFVSKKMQQGDRVLMKMDIEGAEGTVLRHLLDSGVACHLEALYLEWHPVVPSADRAQLRRELKSCGVKLPDSDRQLLHHFSAARPSRPH